MTAAERARELEWAVVPELTGPPPHAWMRCDCKGSVRRAGWCVCPCHGKHIVVRPVAALPDKSPDRWPTPRGWR